MKSKRKGARDAVNHETAATAEQPRSDELGPTGPSGDRGNAAAGPDAGCPAAQGSSGVVAVEVGGGSKPVEAQLTLSTYGPMSYGWGHRHGGKLLAEFVRENPDAVTGQKIKVVIS